MSDHQQHPSHHPHHQHHSDDLGDEIKDVKRELGDVADDIGELAKDVGQVFKETEEVFEKLGEDAEKQVKKDVKWILAKKTWKKIPLIQKFSLAIFGFSILMIAAIVSFGVQETQIVEKRAAEPADTLGRGRVDGLCIVGYYSNHSFIVSGAPAGSPYAGNTKEDLGYISRNALRKAFDQATVNIPTNRKEFKDLAGQNISNAQLANVDVLFVDDFDDGYDVVNQISYSNPPPDPTILAVRDNWLDRYPRPFATLQ